MNIEKRNFLHKFLYSLSANFISLAISVITTLLIPRLFLDDISQYGYLQLYLFYTSYVGFLHFGWVDGILLRDGGKKYSDLDREQYHSQFALFCGFEIIISVILIIISYCCNFDPDKSFVIYFTAINVVIVLMRSFLQYILQATNRIKEYSITISLGRILYLISCLSLMIIGTTSFKPFVIVDTFCKCISLIITIFFCKDIVLRSKFRCNVKYVFSEISENIKVGIKLVFSNVASMLIIGVVRLGIENQWDIATFGKVSLTLSISNMFIIFISAVAVVLFPTLRGIDKNRLPGIYNKISNGLTIIAFGLIVFYYPIKEILVMWLPKYSDGLIYMAILFPISIYLSKVTLVIQTYYQVYRFERDLMVINIISLVLSILFAFISIKLLQNLTLAVVSILLNQAIRCILLEIVLSKKIKLNVGFQIIMETVLVLIFVLANWILTGWKGFSVYLIAYFIFLLLKRDEVKQLSYEIGGFINNNN